MNDIPILVGAFAAGLALGLFYFGGLWLTVRRVADVARPGRFVLVSFLIRLAVALIAFTLIMDGGVERMAVCLVGFMATRLVLLRRRRPSLTA